MSTPTGCLELAQVLNHRVGLIWAHNCVGTTLQMLAEYERSLRYLEEGLKLYDRKLDRSASTTDPAVVNALEWRAWVLWQLGYPEQALDSARDAVSLAREIGNPYSLVEAQIYLSEIYLFGRQFWLAEQLCDEL